MSQRVWPWLLAYVVLLAGRDVVIEFGLDEDSLVLAWLICAIIFFSATGGLLLLGQFRDLLTKMKQPDFVRRGVALGALSTAIYFVTVYLIHRDRLGAARFNLIDFGLAPFCIAYVGWRLRGEPLRAELRPALVLYLGGIVAIHWEPVRAANQPGGAPLLWFALLALVSPVAMGFSDHLAKWFLQNGSNQASGMGPTRAPLSEVQLLAVRFLIPTVLLGFVVAVNRADPIPRAGEIVFPMAIALAFLPLWILYRRLGDIQLQQLCIWETLIPAIIFIVSLWWRPQLFGLWPAVGLFLISAGYIIYQREMLTR